MEKERTFRCYAERFLSLGCMDTVSVCVCVWDRGNDLNWKECSRVVILSERGSKRSQVMRDH